MPTSAQEEQEMRIAAAALAAVWKRHFPTFRAAPRAAAYLASSDPGLLATTAFLLVVVTLAAAVVTRFFDNGRLHLGSLSVLEWWTISCVALIGSWSTLGSGRWHLRFPCACLAALWMIAAQVYVQDWILFPRGRPFEQFVPHAVASFAHQRVCRRVGPFHRTNRTRAPRHTQPGPTSTGTNQLGADPGSDVRHRHGPGAGTRLRSKCGRA